MESCFLNLMKYIFKYLFGKYFWISYSADLQYKGTWKKGLFNGKGRLKYKNGNTFTGFFKDGAKHGYGSLVSLNGYEYHGNWVNGKQTGEGQVHYKNGDIYTGSFLEGLRNGFGELFTAKNSRNYKGYWEKNNLIGEVKVISDTWVFRGKIDQSNLNATGKIIYNDQSSYEGSLFDFNRQGYGVYKNFIGEEIKGIWNNNVNVEKAKKTDARGFVWNGSFKNLQPDGLLRVKRPDYYFYDGIWSKGKMVRALGVQGFEPKPFVINN